VEGEKKVGSGSLFTSGERGEGKVWWREKIYYEIFVKDGSNEGRGVEKKREENKRGICPRNPEGDHERFLVGGNAKKGDLRRGPTD